MTRCQSHGKNWLQILKPKMLYGKEDVCYDKEWINRMESLQHKVGCYILGTRTTVSKAGVRAELGWKTIQGEIWSSKIKLLLGLKRWMLIGGHIKFYMI